MHYAYAIIYNKQPLNEVKHMGILIEQGGIIMPEAKQKAKSEPIDSDSQPHPRVWCHQCKRKVSVNQANIKELEGKRGTRYYLIGKCCRCGRNVSGIIPKPLNDVKQ